MNNFHTLPSNCAEFYKDKLKASNFAEYYQDRLKDKAYKARKTRRFKRFQSLPPKLRRFKKQRSRLNLPTFIFMIDWPADYTKYDAALSFSRMTRKLLYKYDPNLFPNR